MANEGTKEHSSADFSSFVSLLLGCSNSFLREPEDAGETKVQMGESSFDTNFHKFLKLKRPDLHFGRCLQLVLIRANSCLKCLRHFGFAFFGGMEIIEGF